MEQVDCLFGDDEVRGGRERGGVAAVGDFALLGDVCELNAERGVKGKMSYPVCFCVY